MEVFVNEQNFEKEVIKSDIPVLLLFEANWNPACDLVRPTIAELEKEYDGKIKVARLDVDESPEIARKYYLYTCPTVMYFKNGENLATTVGYRPKSTFVNIINK